MSDGNGVLIAEAYVMPFGKYQGKTLQLIPNSYINWLSENCNDDTISSMADIVRRYREKYNIEVK